MQFGIDRLLKDAQLRGALAGRRIGFLAHPASVTADLTHTLDALRALPELHVSAAFGPQHGLHSDESAAGRSPDGPDLGSG